MRSSYLYHGDPYAHKMESLYHWDSMMMISNGNIFHVTGLLPHKGQWQLYGFYLSAPEPTIEQIMETQVIWDAIALIMTSL